MVAFQPNHNKQKCKMWPNNNHEKTIGGYIQFAAWRVQRPARNLRNSTAGKGKDTRQVGRRLRKRARRCCRACKLHCTGLHMVPKRVDPKSTHPGIELASCCSTSATDETESLSMGLPFGEGGGGERTHPLGFIKVCGLAKQLFHSKAESTWGNRNKGPPLFPRRFHMRNQRHNLTLTRRMCSRPGLTSCQDLPG